LIFKQHYFVRVRIILCFYLYSEKPAMAQRKGTAKLKELLEIEHQVQQRWQEQHVFEVDAPEPGSQEAQSVCC